MQILTGKEAKKTLRKLLSQKTDSNFKYPEPYNTGYYQYKDGYIAYDNRSGDCWVESIKDEKIARDWCAGILDTSELHTITGITE